MGNGLEREGTGHVRGGPAGSLTCRSTAAGGQNFLGSGQLTAALDEQVGPRVQRFAVGAFPDGLPDAVFGSGARTHGDHRRGFLSPG